MGDTLLVVQDNNNASFLYALDKKTGREWKQPRDEGSGWTTPFVLEHGGRTEVIISGSNAVRSDDPRTGKCARRQCGGLGSNPVPMAVADDEFVYTMSGHRSPAGLAIALGVR